MAMNAVNGSEIARAEAMEAAESCIQVSHGRRKHVI